MTTHVAAEMTVRELVGRYPQTRPVFEKHGIDYCCGGAKCLADACPTFAAMYGQLQRVEADLHQQIHLDNNILFPRVIELAG